MHPLPSLQSAATARPPFTIAAILLGVDGPRPVNTSNGPANVATLALVDQTSASIAPVSVARATASPANAPTSGRDHSAAAITPTVDADTGTQCCAGAAELTIWGGTALRAAALHILDVVLITHVERAPPPQSSTATHQGAYSAPPALRLRLRHGGAVLRARPSQRTRNVNAETADIGANKALEQEQEQESRIVDGLLAWRNSAFGGLAAAAVAGRVAARDVTARPRLLAPSRDLSRTQQRDRVIAAHSTAHAHAVNPHERNNRPIRHGTGLVDDGKSGGDGGRVGLADAAARPRGMVSEVRPVRVLDVFVQGVGIVTDGSISDGQTLRDALRRGIYRECTQCGAVAPISRTRASTRSGAVRETGFAKGSDGNRDRNDNEMAAKERLDNGEYATKQRQEEAQEEEEEGEEMRCGRCKAERAVRWRFRDVGVVLEDAGRGRVVARARRADTVEALLLGASARAAAGQARSLGEGRYALAVAARALQYLTEEGDAPFVAVVRSVGADNTDEVELERLLIG